MREKDERTTNRKILIQAIDYHYHNQDITHTKKDLYPQEVLHLSIHLSQSSYSFYQNHHFLLCSSHLM